MFSAIATTLLGLSLGGNEPAYQLETVPVKRVEATMTFTFRHPRLSAREWIIYAAKAPELAGQSQVATTMDPGGKVVKEASALKRPVMLARIQANAPKLEKEVTISVKYLATLHARKLVPAAAGAKPAAVTPLKADERKETLAISRMCDYKSPAFQKWIDEQELRRKQGESDLDFARRVFLHVKKTFRYRYPTIDKGSASSVAAANCSDCGGLSTLFVALMRAHGIPARVLVGRWAMSTEPGAKVADKDYHQWHAKAEFFAENVGWVPVDLALALDDKSAAGLNYFGNDQGDFLVQYVDGDLVLDTFHFGKETIEIMQGVVHWMTGAGTPEPSETKENWEVRVLRDFKLK